MQQNTNLHPKALNAKLLGGLFILTALILLSVYFAFELIQRTDQKTIFQGKILRQQRPIDSPTRLTIPAINVDTTIQYKGVTSNGEMDVPSNTVEVAWFGLGPRPGEIGSAVIAGHFNGEDGKDGVFANLNKLKAGDKLYVQNDKGESVTFVVNRSKIYDPGYVKEVFSSNDTAHLNLITCDGVWNEVKKTYSKRLVVFADIYN